MDSTSSINSTMNSSLITFESIKDRASSLLNEEILDEKKLLLCSQDLMTIPNLDDDMVPVSSRLVNNDFFEIAHKDKVNPVFIRNLLNVIQIINFIWIASENNVEIFHKTLLKLGIMFSYLFRNEKDDKEGVDYALLCPIPNIIYDFIAKNGKNSFKNPNDFIFEEDLFSTDKSDTQIGYVYQETSISQILSSFNSEKVTICPKIMYYLEYNSSKELFSKNIFNSPANYLNLVHNEKEFNGYNEIDFSFILSEETKIKENFTFNIVKKKNNDYISRAYSPNESNDIIFPMDTNIFMEIKSSLENIKINETSDKLINMSKRFSYGYKNCAYSSLEKKFVTNNTCYFLIYDNNRIELFNQVMPNLNIDKDVEICYNSVNVPISSIVSLQNQIRELKKETKETNEKLTKLQEQFESYQKKNDFDLSIMKIRNLKANENYIRDQVKKFFNDKSVDHFKIFIIYNKYFIESSQLLKKIIPSDDIIFLNEQIIGKNEVPSNYSNLIMLLENKIKENTFAKDYYIAYKNALTGKNYVLTNGAKCDYPDCSPAIAEMLKNILKFICLLDRDSLLLNSFFGAILYYAITLSESDKEYVNLFFINFKITDIKACVIYLIQSSNPSFILQDSEG